MKAAEGGHLKKVEDRGDGIINPFSTVIFNTVFEITEKVSFNIAMVNFGEFLKTCQF